MQWSDTDFCPEPRKLRHFAALWLGCFLAVALWRAFRHDYTAAAVWATVAIAIGTLGLVFPRAVGPIFVGWTVLAFPIGWIVSNVILAALYFGLFTPVALVFRLTGRDALQLRRRTSTPSYWAKKPTPTDKRRYFRQF